MTAAEKRPILLYRHLDGRCDVIRPPLSGWKIRVWYEAVPCFDGRSRARWYRNTGRGTVIYEDRDRFLNFSFVRFSATASKSKTGRQVYELEEIEDRPLTGAEAARLLYGHEKSSGAAEPPRE